MAFADPPKTNQDARAILERVLANRPQKDFSLKARLFVVTQEPVPVEILVKNTAEDTRTVYRGSNTEALVVQPLHGLPKFYLRGVGELTGAKRTQPLLGSQFTYHDLGLDFSTGRIRNSSMKNACAAAIVSPLRPRPKASRMRA